MTFTGHDLLRSSFQLAVLHGVSAEDKAPSSDDHLDGRIHGFLRILSVPTSSDVRHS